MVRTMSGALMLAIAAAFVITGCGEKIPADLTKNWDEKEGAVMTQLSDVKTKFGDLMAKFQGLPKDSAKAGEMAGIESQLKENETQIGDVEKTLNELNGQKDSLIKAGKAADLQTLWEKAQTVYADVTAKLTGIMASLGPVGEKIQALGTTAAATAPAPDSSSATGSSTNVETAANAQVGGKSAETSVDEKVGEAKKLVNDTKKAAEAKAADARKAVDDAKKSMDGKVKIELKPNTNPAGTKEGSIKIEPNKNPK